MRSDGSITSSEPPPTRIIASHSSEVDSRDFDACLLALTRLCSVISQSTGGLREGVTTVLWYAHPSNSMVAQILGSSYKLDDILFYGAGLLCSLAASSTSSLRSARIPLLVEHESQNPSLEGMLTTAVQLSTTNWQGAPVTLEGSTRTLTEPSLSCASPPCRVT